MTIEGKNLTFIIFISVYDQNESGAGSVNRVAASSNRVAASSTGGTKRKRKSAGNLTEKQSVKKAHKDISMFFHKV